MSAFLRALAKTAHSDVGKYSSSRSSFYMATGPKLFYGIGGVATVVYISISHHFLIKDPGAEGRPHKKYNQKVYELSEKPDSGHNFRWFASEDFKNTRLIHDGEEFIGVRDEPGASAL